VGREVYNNMIHQKNLSLSLLGSFQCWVNENDVSADFRTKKERALLAYLATESNRQHPRDVLGEMFWPGKPEGYARMNLRQALSGIRRAIQSQEEIPPFLLVSDDFVRFNSHCPVDIDCQEFDRIFENTSAHQHQSINTCPECVQALSELVALYRGDFLEEFLLSNVQEFQEWALFHREHYFRRLLTALHILIKHYQGLGQIKLALDYAYRQAKLAPLEESAHRQLMTLLALDGRRSAAMEQYQLCCQILSDELDVSPDLETVALYEKIKAGIIFNNNHPITRPDNTNVPVQFTKFVGREKELAWALENIKDPANRLFTFIGISGVGKTRLAVQAAAKLINSFSDGVWFVPLNAIDHIDLIPQEIARALNIDLGEADPQTAVIETLKTKNSLLIIDNFEHLLEGTTFLLEILRQAPGIKILITSQCRLSYQAAQNLVLKSLPYPKMGDANWRAFDAVELFITRAKRNQPDFQVTERDRPDLIRICEAVDGLPLGLELAAGSLRFYSCAQIAKELQYNLDILQTNMLDIPERHRSLRAAFDQSWAMLPEKHQDAYRRLSVFQGEFSVDDAIATTGSSLAVISDLVDRSLIQKNATGYYLIQPILRQYAAERLEGLYDLENSDFAFYGSESISVTHDPLTKLPNKVLFRDLFKQSLAIAHRRMHFVALLVVEVSDFATLKNRVDIQGSNAILIDVAGILKQSVRESDIVAHLLPGKFAVILENISKYQDGALVTKKIQTNFDQAFLVSSDGTKIALNMGISVFPTDSEDIVKLLHFANLALNQAKSAKEIFRYYSYKEPLLFSIER